MDTIVFTHSANPANALEPGTQEDIRFTAQYVKVWSYEEEMEDVETGGI